MGCDIHFFIEEKINDKWELVEEVDIGRNYLLFGLLSGVRYPYLDSINKEDNYKTSPTIIKANDDYDYHNLTVVTANNLINYNWKKKYSFEGYLDEAGLIYYLNNNKNKLDLYLLESIPINNEIISIRALYVLSKTLLKYDLLYKAHFESGITYYSKVTLKISAYQYCKEFCDLVLPKLINNPDNKRCVMYYDN